MSPIKLDARTKWFDKRTCFCQKLNDSTSPMNHHVCLCLASEMKYRGLGSIIKVPLWTLIARGSSSYSHCKDIHSDLPRSPEFLGSKYTSIPPLYYHYAHHIKQWWTRNHGAYVWSKRWRLPPRITLRGSPYSFLVFSNYRSGMVRAVPGDAILLMERLQPQEWQIAWWGYWNCSVAMQYP